MKKNKIIKKLLSSLMSIAMVVTILNVNTACWYVMGQDELPGDYKKMRKF